MVFPAMIAASADPRLRGAPLAVYVYIVCHRLDLQEYRSLKIDGLATSMRIKRDTASRALRLLTDGGYLEKKHLGRDGCVYRFRWLRAESESAA